MNTSSISTAGLLATALFGINSVLLAQVVQVRIEQYEANGVLFGAEYRGIVLQPNAGGLCSLTLEELREAEELLRRNLSNKELQKFLLVNAQAELSKYTRQYHCELIGGDKIVIVLLMRNNWLGRPKRVFKGWKQNSIYSTSNLFRKNSRLLQINLSRGELFF